MCVERPLFNMLIRAVRRLYCVGGVCMCVYLRVCVVVCVRMCMHVWLHVPLASPEDCLLTAQLAPSTGLLC